jgi:hypothetical protein
LRLPRFFRRSDKQHGADFVPRRRVILWALVGLALLTGIVLYFKYEPYVVPLVL